MSLFSKLFGGGRSSGAGSDPAPAPHEDYKGYRITPGPIREGGHFRVAARIEKEVDGVARRHDLIRADTLATLEQATAVSLTKARQMIDEQGDRLFGDPRDAKPSA